MANTENGKLPFRVVKGPAEKILARKHAEGYVYFTTDTKKIYLDTKTERLSMGGNTGIYYADVKFESSDDIEYYFTSDDIDEGLMPNVKDLILNTDGCFYKVEEISSDGKIKAIKLTIAGSGGSGGGPGGPSSLAGLEFELEYPKRNTTATILAGRPLTLKFTFHAQDEKGESTGNGRYELKINGVVKKTGTVKDGYNEIEVGDLFNVIGFYRDVDLRCYGDIGGSEDTSKSRKFNVNSTLFTVNWDYSDTTVNRLSNDFDMEWSISVESARKTSYIRIDDKFDFTTSEEKLTITKEELAELGIGHGAHKIELYAEAYIGEDTVPTPSDHIIKNVMFYDDVSSGDPGFIVSCPFFETNITQFDTIQIPVMIYHPSNTNGTATIQFKVNGSNKSSLENCANFIYYPFSYTPDESGFVQLQFICGTTDVNLVLEVEPLNLTVSEVGGYEFKFKATEFANDAEIQNWKIGNEKIRWSENFDWINGGLKSGADDVGPYFKIQAGSYMEIPYKMFADDLKNYGACFKMIFKASNCRDYDASIAECMNDGKGVSLKAQGCEIKSLSNSLTARYCEDTYIEYEFDVCKYSANTEDQYLTIWLDGVPAGVVQFDNADSFRQGSSQYLRVGSDDCDVFIYLIKFYKKHLNFTDHLNNFIMDAPNAAEMMRRFNRNDITIKDGHNNVYISPEKLAEKNPDCNVYIYEIPQIPTSKKDVHYGDGNTECCTFTHLKGGSEAIHHYEGVKLRAQGTSSMTYGISAYNLDAKFPEKWSIDDEAIPVNYMNTKVNVASCEGANNALNQEWYNRYQPYKNQKRLQERNDGKVARDTMEFKNGVVFIKDNNKTVNSDTATANNVFKEIAGYVNNPYPRMYSIGNMGNSKKNTAIFHGAGNIYECCVENADNNTNGQRMITIGGFYPENKELEVEEHEIGLDLSDDLFDERGFVKADIEDWGKTFDPILASNPNFSEEECWLDNKTLWRNALLGEGLFEFRYFIEEEDFKATSEFEDFDSYSWELSNRFLRLVRWFAKNNPSQATNEPLAAPVTFQPYKVKGVKATAYSNYKSEDEVLAGIEVAGGTYTNDTAEYRVAKMLRESEDYLILDSILYHYLFIERHTMVDNVAKNTFWNTEDGIHWELTKDYDNDTADGVNNSGNLVFDYGAEVMDNTANGTAIFNARPSAWLHFAHGLRPLREKMYQTLEARGAWAAEPYLAAFEEWQGMIPEICWIEDFNRKYFRPNNVYGDDSYLVRLANGKKTHQRKQFEIYQDQYMNSQYKTNTGEGSLIQWRSRQPQDTSIMVDGKYEIKGKVKMYADGYFTAAIASGAGEPDAVNLHIRGKKGQEIEFSKSQGSPFDDATCYVYSPNLYQEFTNAEGLYPEYITAVAANKLRKITFIPQNDVQKRMLKVSLSFGPNVEEVVFNDCQSVDNAMIGLDLSNCGRLRKLDTSGSDLFTSYTIADSAPIEEIKIHKPTALILSNLSILNDSDNFEIENYDRLRKIQIKNIDKCEGMNSKDILENIYANSPDANIEYDLEDVIWIFDDTDNITDSNIPLLDYLLEKGNTINDKKKELSLTGTATIPEDAYSGSNSLGLYEIYGLKTEDDSSYPNLILNFNDADGNKKLHTVTIKDGDGSVKWSRKYASFANASNADLSESAQGAFNADEAIKKQSSPTQVFEFNNQWKYTIDGTENTGIIKGSDPAVKYLDLSQLADIGTVDITIEPDYTYSTRYYTINFIDKNTEDIFHSIQAEYDTGFDMVKPQVVPIKDDSLLDLTQTYRLKGYSAAKTSNTLINEEYWRVTDNTNLYSVFEEVSVYDIDYSDYLKITTSINGNRVEVTGLARTEDSSKVIYSGGKIVLPAGVNYIGDNAFQSNTSLKKIFVQPNTVIERIGVKAFKDSKLEYFDFANSVVKTIENEAFMNCCLKAKDYDYKCELTSGLVKLGQSALNGGGSTSNMFADTTPITIVIPGSIQRMGPNAIANFGKAQTVRVQLGAPGDLVGELIFDITSTQSVIHSNATSPNATKDIKYVDFYTNVYDANSKIGTGDSARYVSQMLCGPEYTLGAEGLAVTISFIKEGA